MILSSVTIQRYNIVIDYILDIVHFIPFTHYIGTESLYLLIYVTYLCPPRTQLLPAATCLFSESINSFCLIMVVHLFCFQILHISETVQYLSLSDLISLCVIPSRSIHVKWQHFIITAEQFFPSEPPGKPNFLSLAW